MKWNASLFAGVTGLSRERNVAHTLTDRPRLNYSHTYFSLSSPPLSFSCTFSDYYAQIYIKIYAYLSSLSKNRAFRDRSLLS